MSGPEFWSPDGKFPALFRTCPQCLGQPLSVYSGPCPECGGRGKVLTDAGRHLEEFLDMVLGEGEG